MASLDLDAKRRARSDAVNLPHEVTFGGETFSLPAQIPLECLDLMAEAKFMAHRPDSLDLEEIMGLYGEPGESSGSRPSSLSTGSLSKPTSRRATTSTSRKRATDLQPSVDGASSPS